MVFHPVSRMACPVSFLISGVAAASVTTPPSYAHLRAVGQASWEVASWAANPMKSALASSGGSKIARLIGKYRAVVKGELD
jgi:hypothetical protein